MPDYGHDLLFGTFITPSAHNPAQAVALAELTEAAAWMSRCSRIIRTTPTSLTPTPC
ncbi:hypothetical protein ACFQX6_14895 [Streptosporangium lutulentum]